MMIPNRLNSPATLALVLATVATYLIQVLIGGDRVERAVGLIPAGGGGAMVPAWLTFVTYVFPHGSWWHLASNMAGLWFFGRLAEPVMGTGRFVLAYLGSGVATGLVIVILAPHWTKPAVGASGAIIGVLGGFLALQVRRRPFGDPRNLAVVGIEWACWLGIAACLLGRTPPAAPDRVSALLWHLIPFLAGWTWVRVKRRFSDSYTLPARAALPARGRGD